MEYIEYQNFFYAIIVIITIILIIVAANIGQHMPGVGAGALVIHPNVGGPNDALTKAVAIWMEKKRAEYRTQMGRPDMVVKFRHIRMDEMPEKLCVFERYIDRYPFQWAFFEYYYNSNRFVSPKRRPKDVTITDSLIHGMKTRRVY